MTSDATARFVWTCVGIAGLAAIFMWLQGCATPHFMLGDALVCDKGGEFRESASGTTLSCEEGLRWTGPMSQQASQTALGILKAAAEAAPVP